MRVGVISLFIFVASAHAADPITIKIPCDTEPWLKCADMKRKLLDGEANTTLPGGLKVMIREMIDDVYLGKVRMAKNLAGAEDCVTFENLSNPPICSPLKIPENGCVADTVKSYKVPEGVSSDCPKISLVGASSGDHALFSLGRSDLGSLESSNVAAGLVMAISNQGADLKTEITRNELKFTDSSPCYSRAVALRDLITAQSDVKLLETIKACDPNDKTGACSAKEYFNAGIVTILSAYLQLASCRLSDESSKKFIAFTSDPGSPTSKGYAEILKNLYYEQCFYPHRGDPASMRSCYKTKYGDWIKSRARTAFPNVVSSCP